VLSILSHQISTCSGAGAPARSPTSWSGLVKFLRIPRNRTRASGAVQGDRPTILRVLLSLALAASCLAATDLRLIEAVKDRNSKAVNTLLNEHINVNAPQPDGATALAWAVYLDEADTVDLLLKSGATVNTADEYGETPLTLACANGNETVIRKLIDAGADATAARWDGETALMLAARSGSVDAVNLLIGKGAKVDAAESRRGQNALMWAAAEGHSDVVDLLIQNGAKVSATSKGGFTPLVFAAQKGDAKSALSLLKAGADANYTVPSGQSVLQVAVIARKNAVADILLDQGANVNVADKTETTPLHLAAQAGSVELVKKLLAKGANPNARTMKIAGPPVRVGGSGFFRPSGELTPLHLAAKANHADVMRVLVNAGADPKLKGQDGTTLLMSAAGSGHLGVVTYAYELDPEIKAVTQTGSTAVHAAVTGTGQTSTQPEIAKVIQFLSDKGADLDVKDNRGRTPIAIADILPLDTVVDLLTKLIIKSGRTPQTFTKR
jgi:ankyrin repeat protein